MQWKIPNDPINLDRKAQAIARNSQNCSTTSLVGNWNRATQPPFFFLHGRRNTGSFIWICSLFNSSISWRSWILFLCPCKWALRLKARWLNRWTGTTKRKTRPPTRWWMTCSQALFSERDQNSSPMHFFVMMILRQRWENDEKFPAPSIRWWIWGLFWDLWAFYQFAPSDEHTFPHLHEWWR